MKRFDKIIKYSNQTAIDAVKGALLNYILGQAKMYELLHKQIWRKTRSNVWTYYEPNFPRYNNRDVLFIRGWNIQSPSKEPYKYTPTDPWGHNYGLNQLFVDQSPFDPYEGDPKDGIYHDDCYIQPKAYKLIGGLRECWRFVLAEIGDNGNIIADYSFFKQDEHGEIVISNVATERYSKTVNNVTTEYGRLVVAHATEGTVYYELGKASELPFAWEQQLLLETTQKGWMTDRTAYEASLAAEYGGELTRWSLGNRSGPLFLSGSNIEGLQVDEGEIIVYKNGTVIEYTPYTVDNYGDGVFTENMPQYKILPMVYADTGDLTMPRSVFLDEWAEKFELVVHEDKDFWTTLVMVVVIIIVTYITVGQGTPAVVTAFGAYGAVAGAVFTALVVIGATLTIMGILTGNSKLMQIGGIFSAVAGIMGFVSSAMNTAASAVVLESSTYAVRSASLVAAEVGSQTVSGVFLNGGTLAPASTGLTSAAGFGANLATDAVSTSLAGVVSGNGVNILSVDVSNRLVSTLVSEAGGSFSVITASTFVSGAGLMNLAGIGSSVFNVVNQVQMLGTSNQYDMDNGIVESDKAGSGVPPPGYDDNDDDPVMSLLNL